ncbi:MAG: hypothetical protein H0Z33_06320 [Bacillaceae bacterium]|nr:hypothetical protein [Bacillaceae bacterium]
MMDRWLSHPTVIKVVAVVLAVMLWMVVNMDDPPAAETVPAEKYTIHDVEVTARVDADELAVVDMTDTVTVELRGPPALLNPVSIPPDSYQVYVDATGLEAGTYRLPVQHEGFPSNVFVTTNPAYIEITLERKVQAQKPVHIEVIGEPQDGYAIGDAVISPLKVHVTAPESVIERIAQVRAAVNVQDAVETIQKTIPLQAIDRDGNVINAMIQPAIAEVRVPVTSPFKSVPLKINLEGQPADGYSIASVEQNVDNIKVYGPLNVIDNLSVYEGPTINVEGVRMNRFYQLRIPLQEGVEKTEPEFVEVVVHIAESEQKTLENVVVQLNGDNGNRQAEFVEPTEGSITVTLTGAPELLAELSAADIQAYVDIQNLSPEEQRVPVQFNLPPYIELADDQPIYVTINVTEINTDGQTE